MDKSDPHYFGNPHIERMVRDNKYIFIDEVSELTPEEKEDIERLLRIMEKKK